MRHTSYPFARSYDADGGGAADLQTDVMRFMAILSLCLVAIFALVQSIPAHVQTTPNPTPEVAPVSIAAESQPVAVVPAPIPEPTPTASIEAVPPPKSDPTVAPVEPPPRETRTPAAPADPGLAPDEPSKAAASEPRQGFTLRFASDQALTALVAREDIGFYAIGRESASRMQYDRGRVEFWQASVPKQYHEMHASTVPATVRDALRRSGQRAEVTWGVTLPSRLSRDLNRYLSSYSGGDLIIAANGTMRREE